MSGAQYEIREAVVSARPVAGIHALVPRGRVAEHFARYLDQIYAAGRSGAVSLNGQNIFIYRDATDEPVSIDFCVGVKADFAATGNVVPMLTPAGSVATTCHWGDYALLRNAHAAVVAWCRANGRQLEGVSWEMYGHWHDEPARRQTDVYYLLSN